MRSCSRTRRRRTSGCCAPPSRPPPRARRRPEGAPPPGEGRPASARRVRRIRAELVPNSSPPGARGAAARPSKSAAMPRKKRTRRPRPKTPSRVKKRTKRQPRGGQHRAELVGLGLLALGVFLVSVLWLGWSGGEVGDRIANGLRAAVGVAAYFLPAAALALGALMVVRSALVDVRPFRTGLAVTAFGLLLTLGASHGGGVGGALGTIFGTLVGGTGATIAGVLALAIGTLLLTGASAGALLRRS